MQNVLILCTMKTIKDNSVTIILICILFVAVYKCSTNSNSGSSSSSSSNTSNSKNTDAGTFSVKFEQVGYFKNDQQRVFTYFIDSPTRIDKDSVPEELWNAIEKHGKSQMNTKGKNTQSFYYLSRINTPDVTTLRTYDIALDKANLSDPLAIVYIMFNGDKGIVRNPK